MQHSPRHFQGPLRGTRAWWRGMEPQLDQPETISREEPKKDKSRIRKDLVDRVKREIAAGVYDTEEKWEAALDRLLERLGDP